MCVYFNFSWKAVEVFSVGILFFCLEILRFTTTCQNGVTSSGPDSNYVEQLLIWFVISPYNFFSKNKFVHILWGDNPKRVIAKFVIF